MDKIIVTLWLAFALYFTVLLAVAADFMSGVRNAKRNGIPRTSKGFRQTVDKLGRYYNVLLAISLVDVMQMASVWYMETYYRWYVPLFPILTLICTVGLCLIEIKSIYENTEDKAKMKEAAQLFGTLIKNRDDIEKVAEELKTYLESKTPKDG